MHSTLPLNALRAFEAAARHVSLTKAAAELNVSPGAVSHQIRGLEADLGVALFERRVRAIALTSAGKLLLPGVQSGLMRIREAVADLRQASNERVLVVSTPPGMTSKWLAPRLYRFANAHPEIEIRISSSMANADFTTDGVDVAVRNMASDAARADDLVIEKLLEMSFVPVCSRHLIQRRKSPLTASELARMPLIHDDTFRRHAKVPSWPDWFKAAGVANVDVSRGLRFNSSDHALDAAGEGAGVLLAHDLLAYDDLRIGRLVIPVPLSLASGRAYYLVSPQWRRKPPQVEAFSRWIKQEAAAVDWKLIRGYKHPAATHDPARK